MSPPPPSRPNTGDSEKSQAGPVTASARAIASRALSLLAKRFPDVHPVDLTVAGRVHDPRDQRLATAIVRVATQRWITIEYLLNRYLRQPVHQLEPAMQGVLLAAGAQLLFMDRLPAHAVVDESVKLAGQLVRPKARGLANAVLRKLAGLVDWPVHEDSDGGQSSAWSASLNRLPLEDGYLVLREDALPDPEQFVEHLAVATSHPRKLIEQLREELGDDDTTHVCLHGVVNPPTLIHLASEANGTGDDPAIMPHEDPSFATWIGEPGQLATWLADHPDCMVQDPAAALALRSTIPPTSALSPKLILDLCAGQGTKTRQASRLHPEAIVVASDPDAARFATLTEVATALPSAHAVKPADLLQTIQQTRGDGLAVADLIVLDVPCSNTGVLARRPEARYRYREKSMRQLEALQRSIIDDAAAFIAPGTHVLYTTCSILARENQAQVDYAAERLSAEVIHEKLCLPCHETGRYHDGSYHALLRCE